MTHMLALTEQTCYTEEIKYGYVPMNAVNIYEDPTTRKDLAAMNTLPDSAQNGNTQSPTTLLPITSHRTTIPRDNPQDILKRMMDHNLITDFDHWTGLGKHACLRYARENKKPLDWAQACSKNAERHCIACGSDMKGREVWEYYKPGGNKRCICKLCHHEYTMDDSGNLQSLHTSQEEVTQ